MICPKCGSHEIAPAGGDNIVSVSSNDLLHVEFSRCAACGYFGYDSNFPDDDDDDDDRSYVIDWVDWQDQYGEDCRSTAHTDYEEL